MPLFAESEQKIFGDILYDVVNNTVITRSSPGSKMRALVEAVSKKLGAMYVRFDANIAQSFLNGASGKYLDFLGAMMNVPRLGETKAQVGSEELNVRFYVETGLFGDINGGASILVPAGTIISTGANSTGTQYRLPIAVILAADRNSVYVPAEAVTSGEVANVGTNTLRYHNFNNYVDSVNDSLKVGNNAEIVTGHNVETDTNYRFRISNQVLLGEAANATAIRLAALAVPGVAEVVVIPQARGIGSFDLLVQSVTAKVPTSLVSAVQQAVDQKTAMGESGLVKPPVDLGLSVIGTLKARRTLSAAEEANLVSAVTQNITNYVNNLDIAEEFIVNEAVERVMATSDLIKDIGVPGKPFDNLYLYKPSRLDESRVRSELFGNYAPKVDEKISVEVQQAGTTPILFTVA